METVYRKVLAFELRKRGFDVEEEWPIPAKWDSIQLDIGFRADLLVNDVVVVELKSLEKIAAVHKKGFADVSSHRKQASWIIDYFWRRGFEERHSSYCKQLR